jgi:hypothetical protein
MEQRLAGASRSSSACAGCVITSRERALAPVDLGSRLLEELQARRASGTFCFDIRKELHRPEVATGRRDLPQPLDAEAPGDLCPCRAASSSSLSRDT